MPLIVFLVKFVFIFVADFKSIFMPFTTLPFFSHPVKQMYFRLKLIYQIKTEYLEPLSRYSVLNDFLLYKYTYDIQSLVSCLELIIYFNLHVVEFESLNGSEKCFATRSAKFVLSGCFAGSS